MQKVKEIEVWVNRISISSFARADVFSSKTRDMNDDWLKAKLIIELPERKVTITESEFSEKLYDAFHSGSYDGLKYSEIMDKLKEKLFKSEGA